MKKKLSLLLVFLMCFALAVPAHAYNAGQVAAINTISAGGWFTAAIDADGSLWMWGHNESGQLGNNGAGNITFYYPTGSEFTVQTVPMKILDNVVSVSCGLHTAAAIKSDGSLWMWGSNSYGQLGNGSTEKRDTPVKIMDDVIAVSCGYHTTAAIKSDGSLWMWGSNDSCQLGNGTEEDSSIPIKIMDDVIAVSCGDYFTAAIKSDGSLWTWGSNMNGELGNGGVGNFKKDSSYVYYQTVPAKIMDDVTAVSCGNGFAAAVKSDGSLWMWGLNAAGQLGNGGVGNGIKHYEGEPVKQTVPTKIMDDVASVSCSHLSASAAIKKDGSLWVWGYNYDYQLGIESGNAGMYGSYTYQDVPIKIMDDAAAISGGNGHTAILKKDGTLWMCGENHYGQLGNDRAGNATDEDDDVLQTFPIKVLDNIAVSTTLPFSDVPATSYYADAVQWAAENNITGGTSTTMPIFSPAGNVTRAQAVTFLWRTQNCPEPKTAASPFTDVQDAGSWYYKAVLWAAENQITGGTSTTASIFSPDGNVTRGQMMAFLYRAMGEPGKTGTGAWHEDAENWAAQNGLLDGAAAAYSTNGDCPRSDVVYYLWKALAG